jgi:hypothetical protein
LVLAGAVTSGLASPAPSLPILQIATVDTETGALVQAWDVTISTMARDADVRVLSDGSVFFMAQLHPTNPSWLAFRVDAGGRLAWASELRLGDGSLRLAWSDDDSYAFVHENPDDRILWAEFDAATGSVLRSQEMTLEQVSILSYVRGSFAGKGSREFLSDFFGGILIELPVDGDKAVVYERRPGVADSLIEEMVLGPYFGEALHVVAMDPSGSRVWVESFERASAAASELVTTRTIPVEAVTLGVSDAAVQVTPASLEIEAVQPLTVTLFESKPLPLSGPEAIETISLQALSESPPPIPARPEIRIEAGFTTKWSVPTNPGYVYRIYELNHRHPDFPNERFLLREFEGDGGWETGEELSFDTRQLFQLEVTPLSDGPSAPSEEPPGSQNPRQP